MKNTYTIDPAHSSANFVIRHLMISNVRGAFSKVTGTVVFDPEDPKSTSINAVIDANSLNTLDAARDAHVKGADFLDTATYPEITFVSKGVKPSGSDELKVTGDLSIHGVTKEVELNVEGPSPEGKDPWGNLRMGASAATKIKRSDFGLMFNGALETGGVMLGDDLKIELEIELIKGASAAA